jgi:protein subunit release factor B
MNIMNFSLRKFTFLTSARVRIVYRSQLAIFKSLTAKCSVSFTESKGREDEIKAAREWLHNFNANVIPRKICDVSFSRSSGPGGQNVNKCVSVSH